MAKVIQCIQVNFTSSSGSTPVMFDGQDGVTSFVFHTSADCYIDFDQPVAPTTSYKLLTANTADTVVDGFGGTVKRLYVQAVGGGGTLYLIASTR